MIHLLVVLFLMFRLCFAPLLDDYIPLEPPDVQLPPPEWRSPSDAYIPLED